MTNTQLRDYQWCLNKYVGYLDSNINNIKINFCGIKACDLSRLLTAILSIIVDFDYWYTSNFDSRAGIISWLFPPAIAAGVFFDVPVILNVNLY
jgi:hypothetical protein